MKELKEMYYIVFNNCEGSFPQRDSESFSKEDVKKKVDELNGMEDNPYAHYSVGIKKVWVNEKM